MKIYKNMENNIQMFDNPEFGNIRTMKIDGNPWFVAKDLYRILGIQNSRDTLSIVLDEVSLSIIYIFFKLMLAMGCAVSLPKYKESEEFSNG